VTKVYGEEPPVPALRGVSFRSGGASWSRSSTVRLGQVDAPARHRDARAGRRVHRPDPRIDAAQLSDRELSGCAPGDRFVFQQFFPWPNMHGARERRRRAAHAGVPAADRFRRRTRRFERSGLAERATSSHNLRRRRQAGCIAHGHSSGVQRSSSPTNRPGTSTAPRRVDHGAHPRAHAAGATINHDHARRGLADQAPRQIRVLDGHDCLGHREGKHEMNVDDGRLR